MFTKEGHIDATLSLLDEMKSNSFDAYLIPYNLCINCFGKLAKVDITWKFFHEMKKHELVPDDATYTRMLWVLCKARRLD